MCRNSHKWKETLAALVRPRCGLSCAGQSGPAHGRVPAARGRYVFGDLCTGIVSSFKIGPKGRASTPVRLPGLVNGLSSFGEDANGELYALSLDGTLYQLR